MQKNDTRIVKYRQNRVRNLFLCVVIVLGMLSGCSQGEKDVLATEPLVIVEQTEMPTEAPTVAPTEAPTEPATESVVITYVISYEVNGGNMPGDFKVIYTEEEPMELPIPAKPGFMFEGWYESEDFSGDPVTTTEGAIGDKTYYAKWKDTDGDTSGNQGGNAHTHAYTVQETVTATCLADGYTVYKCDCGKTYKDDYLTGSHNWGIWIVVKEATSKEDGLKERSCSVCKSVESEKLAKLPEETKPFVPEVTEPEETEHVHSYTSAVTKPTCTEKGYTTYKCDCGNSYTANEVAKTGHNYKATTVAPTTSAQGYTLHTCKNCGNSYKDSYVDKLPVETKPSIPEETNPAVPEETEHVHNYESKVVAPTTSHRGYTLHTCASCGHSYKDNYVDKLPETEPEDPYNPPEIENHTHTWGSWIEHADGYKYRICPECGSMDLAW